MSSKIKIEDIQTAADYHGWKLISKIYKNLSTEIEFSCPEGHIVRTTWKKMRNNFKCPFCEDSEENKKVIEIKPKSKGITRVIALDDATVVTGWAIYDDKKLVDYGKIELIQQDTIERISKMHQWLINMIDNWKPDYVAIEDIQLQNFTGKNGYGNPAVTTYKVLAQLQGVLLVTCYEKNIPCFVIHAATWRAHCKIKAKNRADQKRAAQLYVQNKYDVHATQDEADAICIGTYIVEKHIKNTGMIEFGELDNI